VKHTPFALVALLAVPLLGGAQEQTPNPRPGWPCGARLDTSYFRLAEGSGGHLLLLAPEEIGDSATLLTSFSAHPQTILRIAGSVPPGLHEFSVPVDPSVESVLFSISVQCLQVADVVRPSGALAVGDDVTDLSNFRAQHMVIVRKPEAGTWTLRVLGSGVSGIVVQARSARGMGQVEFAPEPGATFSAIPLAGVENTVRLHVSGDATDIRASLVSGNFQQLADLPLAAGETTGTYLSRFTPDAAPFRVLVTGKDTDGFFFQRMSAPLVTPAR